MGSLFMASIPMTELSAASKTVHSNVMGIYAGQLSNGRPATLCG